LRANALRSAPLSRVITSTSKAILATLAYYDQFNRPLTAQEITQRLISWPANETQITAALAHSPLLRRHVVVEGGYCQLAGRTDLVSRYEALAGARAQKWRRIERFSRVIASTPFVRCILVGGSLANGSATPGSDLDLIILTAEGRLWLARAIISALRRGWNLFHRRSLRTAKLDRIDLLFMASPAGFTSPHQSLYAAILLRDAIVVYDEAGAAEQYRAANPWVQSYCPSLLHLRRKELRLSEWALRAKRAVERISSGPSGAAVERMLFASWPAHWDKFQPEEDHPARLSVVTPARVDVLSYYWEDRALSALWDRFAALVAPASEARTNQQAQKAVTTPQGKAS
jgi:hypothetical protein